MKFSTHRSGGLELAVAETGDGRPFVFQHGLCGDALQPADVFPSDIGWRCLTLECRGHGRSPAGDIEQFSIASFAGDLASMIEARGLAPVVVGGISMGAAIALRLAVRRPDLVGALVLARPAWLDRPQPPNMAPNAVVADLLHQFAPAEALSRFDQTDMAKRLAAEAPDNLASLKSFFKREPVAVTRGLLARISADGPGVDRAAISEIRVPTLVVGSARDAIHPWEMAEELARLIPSARLAEITPKADDLARYRADFRTALATFLQELP
ncbi:alpha/beta fold hydrolase [Mesorhizobium sp. BAC0120]|uniref:alpha/beta fold hydrolase n=1 Tax=Mesorhizobium sp. BAC0120 TaxID=3090670 RepID=UPI00298D03C6|nr:alpha/beta fold hydrolase [Mesorhizobium sp. BAC0120]MDW6024370.1 alpha/beta fold hydrolase [Mesorhizobium sp. BAC0120]